MMEFCVQSWNKKLTIFRFFDWSQGEFFKKKYLINFVAICPYFMFKPTTKQRVCHIATLPFTLKIILKAKKKTYGNSNISPCKNIISERSFKRNQNPSRYYNSMVNVKFQHKPKYHLSKIFI